MRRNRRYHITALNGMVQVLVTLLEPIQTASRVGSDAAVTTAAARVVEEVMTMCMELCSGVASSNVTRTFQVRSTLGYPTSFLRNASHALCTVCREARCTMGGCLTTH